MKKYSGLFMFLAMIAAAIFLWQFDYSRYLKPFIIICHEFGHGLGSLLSGGSFQKVDLTLTERPLGYAGGGVSWLVALSGYVGSLIFGYFICSLGREVMMRRAIFFIMGVVIFIYTVTTFEFFSEMIIGFIWAAFFFAYAVWVNYLEDYLIIFLGMMVGIYPLLQLSDFLLRGAKTDFYYLNSSIEIPPLFGLIIFGGVSIYVMYRSLRGRLGI